MRQLKLNFSAPLGTRLASVVTDQSFLADARKLVELSEEQFESMITALNNGTIITGEGDVEKIVSGLVDDESNSIERLIFGLNKIISSDGGDRIESLDTVDEVIRKRMAALDDSQRGLFAERIRAILGSDAIELLEKADSLAKLGTAIEGAHVVCDLRPVFNTDRTAIVAMLPMTSIYLDIEGRQSPLMFNVTPSVLHELCDKLLEADAKLSVIEQYCTDKSIKIPLTTDE